MVNNARAPGTLPDIPDSTPLPDVFRRVCEAAADALQVERVGVWLLVNHDKTLRCVNLFERSKRQHSKGATLQVADFPNYFRSVAALPALPSTCSREDPRTAELKDAYLVPLGIMSMLDAPLIRDGRMVGVLCHEHVGASRAWNESEREYARALADLVVDRMRIAEVMLARQQGGFNPVESERAEAISRMAAGVAHDFKNLLAVILGNASLITSHADLPSQIKAQARQIAEAAERGNTLVRELLDFGRSSTGLPRILNVPDTVSGFVHLLQAAVGQSHRVEYSRQGNGGRVLIDQGLLERAVLNLTLNARDAMPQGGVIHLHVVSGASPDGEHGAPAYVRIDVRDSGAGMSATDRARIFEPFFTTKPAGQGTGLGLAVVQRAVDLVGGFVRVESEPGRGSIFQLFLPRVTGEG